MATIKKFEDILAWQKARDLNKFIGAYIDTGRFHQLVNERTREHFKNIFL
jgi:hypothetical protein